ncbi:hypothetical protein CDD83_1865 [Cordyceps sp. RAO-2017]|nr:hypothetical protein CDD83_1865 [Cordyceps sp. RAO-2017]
MGSYTFKWEHDAEEAFVTGTFDHWRKSVRLERKNGVFQKTVQLDEAADKIYYKQSGDDDDDDDDDERTDGEGKTAKR